LKIVRGLFLALSTVVPAVAGDAVDYSVANEQQSLGAFDLDGPLSEQHYLDVPFSWKAPSELAPQYPAGFVPGAPATPAIRLPAAGVVRAVDSDTRFNDQDSAYRIAYHLSHYGGMPDSAGDLNGDGIEDFVNMSHFAYVKGMKYAGEVHVWYGRKAPIDTLTEFPDLVLYGDEAYGKFGISVASARDFNGDGFGDLLISAAFRTERLDLLGVLPDLGDKAVHAGRVYLIYGGPSLEGVTQIDIAELGKSVPGVVFRGGFDGSRMVGWANGLEAGDFNADGFGDFIVGSYDPYDDPSLGGFPARAYVLFGSKHNALRETNYRLGVPNQNGAIRQSRIRLHDHEVTTNSLSFGAAFIGDVNADGLDDVALTAGEAGEAKMGQSYLFFGRPDGLPADQTIDAADVVLSIPAEAIERTVDGGKVVIRPRRVEQVRPVADFNCDGQADFLVTARATSVTLDGTSLVTGAAAVFFGRDSWPGALSLADADVWIINRHAGNIGQPAVDRHVDLSGDGCADILVNDPYYIEDIQGTPQWRGRVWALNGSANPPPVAFIEDDAALTFVADNAYPGMFGYTWQTGDWNGDGRFDVVVGDHYHGDDDLNEHAGVTYLFYNGKDFSLN
jgi:hypothetical protein